MTQSPPTHCWFYSHRNNQYKSFSNFGYSLFTIDGKEYTTGEHYFQSKKFEGTEHEEIVRNAETAREAKMLGGQQRRPLRPDWEQVKEDIMYTCIKAKFSQNPNLLDVLLRTDDLIICEHTHRDKQWGDGNDPQWTPESIYGKNKLGVALMRLREELKPKK